MNFASGRGIIGTVTHNMVGWNLWLHMHGWHFLTFICHQSRRLLALIAPWREAVVEVRNLWNACVGKFSSVAIGSG